MKKTEFDSLDTKELKEGFLKGGESALMHFRAARLLAENEFYQLACAHLILGGEEGMKALVFFSRFEKFLTIEFNHEYFHKHPPKHDALRKAHRVWQDVLRHMFQIFHESNTLPVWMKEADIKILHAHMQIDEKYVDDWWKKANSLKNQAFYVTKRLHGWEGPDPRSA